AAGNAAAPATDCAPLQHRRAVPGGNARIHPHAPAGRRGARSRPLHLRRHRSDRETLGRSPAPREHPMRSLSRHRLCRSEAIDRGRCRGRGVLVPRQRHVTEASPPAKVTQFAAALAGRDPWRPRGHRHPDGWLSLRPRAHGARADPMSKFIEALEQAERDRALRRSPDVAPVSAPVVIDDVPSAPAPVAELPDGARALDQHLVSLLKPTSFEAEQYRSLRHLIEHLHRTAELSVVAVSSPVSNDGKTTTAINIAGALAQDPQAAALLFHALLRLHPLPR